MTARRLAGVGGLLLLATATSGCAERRLVTAPSSTPGTGTWVAVWMAGVLAAGLVGVLLTLPAWRVRSGSRVAVAILTAQSGAIAVVGVVLTAVAARTWQLLDRPADAAPVHALVRLSRVDGDTALLALIVLVVVAVAALLAGLSALAARFAAGSDPVERWATCVLLAAEIGVASYAAVRLVLGARGWPFVGGTLALPVAAVAFAAAWPTHTTAPAS